jgi:hypothetical protein
MFIVCGDVDQLFSRLSRQLEVLKVFLVFYSASVDPWSDGSLDLPHDKAASFFAVDEELVHKRFNLRFKNQSRQSFLSPLISSSENTRRRS